MKFLEKARSLSETKRKIIFWMILIIIVLAMVALWLKNAQNKFENFNLQKIEGQINIPSENDQ